MPEVDSYTSSRASLGIKAIDEIIRKYMHDMRWKENDPLSPQSNQDSNNSGSKGSPSIISAWQDKVQSYEAYFIDGKSLLVSFFLFSGDYFSFAGILLQFIHSSCYCPMHYYKTSAWQNDQMTVAQH